MSKKSKRAASGIHFRFGKDSRGRRFRRANKATSQPVRVRCFDALSASAPVAVYFRRRAAFSGEFISETVLRGPLASGCARSGVKVNGAQVHCQRAGAVCAAGRAELHPRCHRATLPLSLAAAAAAALP